MKTLDLPDYNHEDEEGISDEQLEKIREKTFTSDLTGLISKVTTHTGEETNSETVTQESVGSKKTVPSLLSRIHSLMYLAFADLQKKQRLSLKTDTDADIGLFEYELQRFNISKYAFYCYSMTDEAYKAVYSRMVNKEYIGVYSSILEQAISNLYAVDGEYVYLSFYRMLRYMDPDCPVNSRLMPIAVIYAPDFDETVYRSLVNKTSLPQILTGMTRNCSGAHTNKSRITIKKIHLEVARLQHNYYLISESICYIFTYKDSDSPIQIRRCVQLYKNLKNVIGNDSTLYLFNNTTIIAFVVKEDITTVHNHYLTVRSQDLLLFNLDDFKGKNFLKRVYSIAYNKKMQS
ncbi:MAG: hypothetical protein PF637_08015 [Spirochaetes bacterium]|jgi:hypothetical protein|nr:hypothetical protein [Spirochaetota bacterium]